MLVFDLFFGMKCKKNMANAEIPTFDLWIW